MDKSAPSNSSADNSIREQRQRLGLTQQQLSELLGVPKSTLNVYESIDKPMPSSWREKFDAVSKVIEVTGRPPVSRLRNWRQSKNFVETPPFDQLPTCPCGIERCRLDPEKDLERSPYGHFWLFRGRECKKRRYLDITGSVVPAPPSRRRDTSVPVIRCKKCGKIREVSRKRFKLFPNAIFLTVSCRGKAADHDPLLRLWQIDGKTEMVPPDVLEKLRIRLRLPFDPPMCSVESCDHFGKRMEFAGRRGPGGEVYVFRCRSRQSHVTFCGPSGQLAEKVGFSHYRWQEAGAVREIRSRMGRIAERRAVPHLNCPVHNVGLHKFSGPHRNKRTGRLTWGLVCPAQGERYYYDGHELRTKKLPGRVKKGRRSQLSAKTLERIQIAAQARREGLNKWQIARRLFPGTHYDTAYQDTKKFFRSFKVLIEQELKKFSQ